MTLMEQFDALAKKHDVNQQEATRFWTDYYEKEKEVYSQMLDEPGTAYTGTVSELAEKFGMDTVYFGAFLDGINESIKEPNPVAELEEDSTVTIDIDPEKLYYNMVAAKADWLYELPQWEGILGKEKMDELYKAQKRSMIVVKGKKVGRNDPCPCGSGKKYKFCCGK
ncbi:MAG: SEC-C domain-containing protein [Lachnospiraceae bacterium]|nr:SEC-C domain-containing protein [Lachnospiraceae bacterium]